MLRFIERKMMVELGGRRIRHVGPIDVSTFRGLAQRVLRQLEDDFMAAPPLTLHAPAPRVFAAAWGLIRETLLAGPTSRVDRETVAATVSYINECPYCIDAHTGMLHGANRDGTAGAVRRGAFDDITEPRLRALSRWAAVTRSPGAQPLLDPPFADHHAVRLRSTAVSFHYLNRVVHVFLGASPMQLPEAMRRMRAFAMRIGGRMMMRRFVDRELPAGQPILDAAEAELPESLAWAASDPAISRAMTTWVAELEAAGREALSEQARTLVNERLAAWKGEDVGFGRGWLDDALGSLEGAVRAEVELCLLVALRSYSIDDDVVVRFQVHHSDPAKVVAATAWAAMRAALRVGSWLAPSRVAESAKPEPPAKPTTEPTDDEPDLVFELDESALDKTAAAAATEPPKPNLVPAKDEPAAAASAQSSEPEPESERKAPWLVPDHRSAAGSRAGAKPLHLIAVPPKDEPKR